MQTAFAVCVSLNGSPKILIAQPSVDAV